MEKLSKDRKHSLYLVTDTDIPFVQDGTRDGEHIRQWMHNYFIKRLQKTGRDFIVVSGSREKRLEKAIECIKRL